MSGSKLDLPLWEHQKYAIALANKYRNLALFHEMGCGKSRTLVNILRYKFSDVKMLRKTLIISPVITLENWKREFEMFSKVFPGDIVVLRGTGKQRLKQLLHAITDHQGQYTRNRIVITNYETMQMKEIVKVLHTWRPEILVCDESHRLRNHKSKRARTVAELADVCKHRYLLTGSPILNSVADIFYQYRILDGGKTFGDNYYAFQAKYLVDTNANWSSKPGYFPKYVPREELFAELSNRMYAPDVFFTGKQHPSKAHRVLKKDCLDLPPLLKQVYPIELSADQKRMYMEMRDEYLTYVENLKKEGQPLAVVAQLAITKALRLQQITSGYVKADDGQEYGIDDNPRLEALRGLLEEICVDHKVIIWACFRFNYVQLGKLCEELGLAYRALHGDIPTAQKQVAIDDFRNDPKIKVMIANQASAGVGVNLTEAKYSIFFSRNFSLEQDLQAESRNYRGGSEMHENVTRIDLIAPDTIDQLIAEALASKQNVAEKVLSWKI